MSVAEEPPQGGNGEIRAVYFVVEHDPEQLAELTRLADAGELRPLIDRVFSFEDFRAAFERSMERGKRGKVVLRVSDDAD